MRINNDTFIKKYLLSFSRSVLYNIRPTKSTQIIHRLINFPFGNQVTLFIVKINANIDVINKFLI